MSIDKRLISTGAAAVCTTDTLDIFGDSSCVALYGLNYDGSDAGGNYDGNSTDVDFNAPGHIDYAAYFNGSSSVITLPSALSDGATMDASCISFWFNVGAEVTSATSNKEVMSFAYSGGSTGKITLGSTSGAIANETFSVSSDVTSQYTYSKTNIPAGWNHAVVQWNSGNTKWDIYINGVAHTTYTFGTNEQGKFALKFGNRSSYYYEGKLDQVRIFNKALSSSEVTTLYGEVACEYTCTTDTNGFPASASSDIVAYYKLDNDATDDTGTYDGTATDVTFDGGRYGSSAVFNGSSSFINTGISNTTIPLSSDFSISAWINTNSSSGFFIAEGDFNSWNTAGFALGIVSGNKVELSFGNVAPSGGPQVQSSALAADTWYHIVGVVDIGNVLTLYVNGVSVGTDTITSSNRTSVSGGFNIGRDAGGYDYTGKLDQVRFYTKALSSTEVSTIYEDEHQCYITVDSTDPFGDGDNIALYEFENNANDSTGSYNGTASNVTYSTDSIIGTYSASFNGSSSYITLGSASSLVATDFTFSAWIKTTSTSTDFIVGTNVNPYYSKVAVRSEGNGTISCRYGNYTSSENNFSSSYNTINNGAWHHIVYFINQTTAKLYIDGSLDTTHTLTVTPTTNGDLTLGTYYNDNNNSYNFSNVWDGTIDQVRIFDRQLNGDEVWKLYAEGAKG